MRFSYIDLIAGERRRAIVAAENEQTVDDAIALLTNQAAGTFPATAT